MGVAALAAAAPPSEMCSAMTDIQWAKPAWVMFAADASAVETETEDACGELAADSGDFPESPPWSSIGLQTAKAFWKEEILFQKIIVTKFWLFTAPFGLQKLLWL